MTKEHKGGENKQKRPSGFPGLLVIKVGNWVGCKSTVRGPTQRGCDSNRYAPEYEDHSQIYSSGCSSFILPLYGFQHPHRKPSGCRVSPETPNHSDAISINHPMPGTQTRSYRIDTPTLLVGFKAELTDPTLLHLTSLPNFTIRKKTGDMLRQRSFRHPSDAPSLPETTGFT